MANKVAIIGAGVSGLSAGIHALLEGFEVDIYEMNAMAGGECTGWDRNGYHIDNCIHFLVGCNEGEEINELWKNLGVISEKVNLYREPYFYCMEMDGVRLYLWRDIERTRTEFLAVAPEDEKELNLFFNCVQGAECIKPPCKISPAHMNLFQCLKMVMSMKGAAKASKEYGKQSMAEFADRFKNRYVRAMMKNFFNNNFIALTFVTSYAFYTCNTAAIPESGSTGMIRRMMERFTSLGGHLHTSAKVNFAEISEGEIVSMKLSDERVIEANYFIWSADPWPLFNGIIDKKYMDPNLEYMYEHPEGYIANTGYQAAFGITTNEELNLPEGSVIFPCDEYEVAGEGHDFCGIRVYDYDPCLYPIDRRVIQCNIIQNSENYKYWEALYPDKVIYDKEKQRIAEELKKRIIKHYPQLEGKLILLGTYSPLTFNRWCNAHQGSYMSFNALKGYKNKYIKSTVKGVSNLFLASQWVQNSGGLPIAAAGGRFAVQQLCKTVK